MSLKDRRREYEWPPTRIDHVRLVTDKKNYASGDTVKVNVTYRIVGGLREAFHPDVWTVAWEDFDKRMPLTMRLTLGARRGIRPRKLEEIKKEVRRASFYWSRDPDLPYRIWVMIMPEDGGPPKIPRNVEDARSKMLDVEKEFGFPASSLGPGYHGLIAEAKARWGRRSFIEKGDVESASKPVVIEVE
ncbi:MAG: hypothetical protein JRM79_02225 [Nitrososphaerota archaeon]|nr:hypothetical protein [Nitrososphaerota archaeon]MDG6903440.1 hypothetical protein [Nitrososphaerota archaeon]MDG6924817.1 hypothetical protein [Nitrososphaerota archaeon]MDG6940819.1 hypothetical protein [Nitrososphaerota archaeon]MDG6945209.1 hypothetical protein [Nitrososphaerota archaeon]